MAWNESELSIIVEYDGHPASGADRSRWPIIISMSYHLTGQQPNSSPGSSHRQAVSCMQMQMMHGCVCMMGVKNTERGMEHSTMWEHRTGCRAPITTSLTRTHTAALAAHRLLINHGDMMVKTVVKMVSTEAGCRSNSRSSGSIHTQRRCARQQMPRWNG